MAGRLDAHLARERTVRIGGLHGGALGYVLAHLATTMPLLIVMAEPKSVDALRLDLESHLGAPSLPFPLWPRSDRGGAPDTEVLQGRATVLRRLRESGWDDTPPPVIVSTLASLVQRVPGREVLEAATLDLAPGVERALPVLLEHLASAGYARVGAVETPGEFASRGGLLDVWPWGSEGPARLDFFGDEIESIRRLDPATQRSGDARDALAIPALPAERFADPHRGEGADFLMAHLPADARVVLVEREALIGAATSLRTGGGTTEPADVARVEKAFSELPVVIASALAFGDSEAFDVDVGGVDALRGIAMRQKNAKETPKERTERIADAFAELGARVDRIVIHRRADGEEERLDEIFDEHPPGAEVRYRPGSLSRSFIWRATKTAHVAYDDLADLPLRERHARGKSVRSRPIQDFLELVEGSPVVHLHHGIGMYRGLVELENQGQTGEYLQLEFAEGTIVYVPVARIDLVQRYVGTGRRPKLSKIGGQEWSKRKAKVSEAVEELAEQLLETQAQRAKRRGQALPVDTEWQREFEDAFPHKVTPDQAAAVSAIKGDLEGDRPMDRLVCGDVGYGKTEVALRALFKVIASGRQAAVLVPTKVLAEQHWRVFTQRLAPYPLTVRVLSGLHAPAENRAVVAGLKAGTVDLVVGTHRLLSKDVEFARLGLVVIDEEQRFGVKHKERLKEMRSEIDVLALSATPIPRTLHMALLGIRDISNLTTPPLGRHPIETQVARESDELVTHAIRRELARGGQVFMVSSRIRELPMIASHLQQLVPELRCGIIHGQMDKDLVENRMMRFVRGELDLLLATTIIESGLDIPNANTIILRDADRYGLSELHQLRGRVGRERRKAHALVLMPKGRPLRDEAAQRLQAIEEYSELGAGFRIAMRDLEIRGAGNLLGAEQSGHIAAVGYEMYCQLLDQSVQKLTSEGEPEQIEH
ncbi:MAG: CarD family transcriptional regulator, partial [Planctomycetota bacterium]|nr:CarD family transcriptional regulator [Planctomycetota bacterium]